MVYYTYVTYQSTSDVHMGEYFNWVMVTPDQNTANTYFRALQETQTVTQSDVNGTLGAKLTFTSVDRHGPQFWSYDSSSGENFHLAARALCGNPKMKQVNPDFASVFGKIRVYWIGAYADGRFRTFFPQDGGAGADDGDVLSGHSFFVKRRGMNDWWYLASSGNVIVDSSRRSRFIFTVLRKFGHTKYPKMPITDDDEVRVEVVEGGIRIPVGLKSDNELVAGTNCTHQKFTFGDLKSRFSLMPGILRHLNDEKREEVNFVTWTKTESLGGADSFEVVEGIDFNQIDD
ncbi:hypothetical protein N7492_010409 [Penicillium capsulatum]|uniref:Uncharacterized protein n=1 Tax=Penicillium capsulatum TaxID=69766 RepID=A0A9W9HRA2_9EURO|nr:hypothetical protein N7492_010409 [Penicillium capsulatum]KAJ6112913.1 hypothetical protein N7512_008237 [Penicillium capsulatum]